MKLAVKLRKDMGKLKGILLSEEARSGKATDGMTSGKGRRYGDNQKKDQERPGVKGTRRGR